jgi:hypothetical protein
MRSAEQTFLRKSDASRWLTLKEAEIKRGDWLAPELSAVLFRDYAADWLRDRVLKVRTQELCGGLLRNHLLPTFGAVSLGGIDEATVRKWRKDRLLAGRLAARRFGPVTVAKAYWLLMRFSRPWSMTGWSDGTRARSRERARRTRQSGRHLCT